MVEEEAECKVESENLNTKDKRHTLRLASFHHSSSSSSTLSIAVEKFSMSTLVDFQQQRKRSKVYPQLNFLLLRKIAPELSLLYVYVGVLHVCACVCVW